MSIEQSAAIDTLLAERHITKLILKFGRSLDRGDWEGYRACFADFVRIDFQRMTGQAPILVSADLWTTFAGAFLSRVRRHHTYSNIDITLDGARAHARVYMTARHWAPSDQGAAHNTQYGWYDFHFVRQADAWLIDALKHDFQWVDGNGALLDAREPELLALLAQVFSDQHAAAARADAR